MLAAARARARLHARSGSCALRALSTKPPAPAGPPAPPKGPPPPPAMPDDETCEKSMAAQRKAHVPSVLPQHIRQLPDIPYELPENLEDIGVLAVQPERQRKRHVIIGQAGKSSDSSFTKNMHTWHLNWQRDDESSNPLMGWSQSTDPLFNTSMKFDTPEQAVAFCKKMGWTYEVEEPEEFNSTDTDKRITYAHNFLPARVLNDLERNKTKCKHFAFPTANNSHYFRPLNFHGTGKVKQHGPEAQASSKQ